MRNLCVFSNLRGMQEFLKKDKKAFLTETLSIKDFFSQVVLVKNKKKAPPILQKIFLSQVFKEFPFNDSQKQFLFFEYNFLGFLETSSFLFKLFSEAFESQVQIKDMMKMDIYGEYEDHLRVIEKIHQSYQEKLHLAGYYDFPYQAEIFWDFLKVFDRIDFFIEGVLSAFEFEILSKIAQKIPVFLHLKIDAFNLANFSPFFPFLEVDYAYIVCLSSGEVVDQKSRKLTSKLSLNVCEFKVDECCVVIEKVNQWLQEGIDAQKIAVVVPNRDFLPILMACDEAGNFNYAMGKEIVSEFALEEIQPRGDNFLQALIDGVESRIHQASSSLKEKLDYILLGFKQSAEFLKNFSFEELLRLFLGEIEHLREEDVQGGKIRVIEILETRGMEFEKVIVVDFNQDQIPTLSNQDMFLNTFVRQSLKMPTIKDKQNLQKHYYLELFKNAKEVQILCLKGKMANFIYELGLQNYPHFDQESAPSLSLFPPHQMREYQEDEIHAEVPPTMAFSATSLNAFKHCKRKFYFYYLAKIAEKEDQSEALEEGREIHKILCQAYQANLAEIKNEVFKRFNALQETCKDHRSEIRWKIALRELQKFLNFEEQNLPDEILGLEESFCFESKGIKFSGIIDRIDRIGDNIRIIDYKYTSKSKFASSRFLEPYALQAVIYYLYALEKYGKEASVYFVFLKDGAYHQYNQRDLQQGISDLEHLLEEVFQERSFAKTDKLRHCDSCVYKILCNR